VLGVGRRAWRVFFRRQLVDKPHDIKGDSIVGSGAGGATTSRPPKSAVGVRALRWVVQLEASRRETIKLAPRCARELRSRTELRRPMRLDNRAGARAVDWSVENVIRRSAAIPSKIRGSCCMQQDSGRTVNLALGGGRGLRDEKFRTVKLKHNRTVHAVHFINIIIIIMVA